MNNAIEFNTGVLDGENFLKTYLVAFTRFDLAFTKVYLQDLILL